MLRSFRQRQDRLKDISEEAPSLKKAAIADDTPLETKAQFEKEAQSEKEPQVEISHVYKSFGGNEVVKDVSFTLGPGEVFGLVGPNGAGKTTTIRMLMDIIRPDSGEIRVFGQPLDEDTKNRIGYLPEERGLYQKMRVSDSLVYLASLKNVEPRVAKERGEELLRQVDMLPHKGKKISELSRGMGQIIQFLVTIAHNPDLIILDEPFAGLDPVNRQLLKDIAIELKRQGKTIILSTHMMNEVEEMCDRILMIDEGRVVLYGELAEIKWRFRNNSVFVGCEGTIGELEGVSGRKEHGKVVELFLDGETSPQKILSQLVERDIKVDRFEVSTPSLNEIFLQVVKR
ncbi:MAG: ATP-binding cassette domain-containing protein [Dehalococcoidia bacterium]|nr:ATP-binding cassette domain-containing protein [Dehalococcoidia bacterium]